MASSKQIRCCLEINPVGQLYEELSHAAVESILLYEVTVWMLIKILGFKWN